MVFESKYCEDDVLKILSSEWGAAAPIAKALGCTSTTAISILLRLAADGKVEMKRMEGVGRVWRLKGETE